jgi:hypothetical protein
MRVRDVAGRFAFFGAPGVVSPAERHTKYRKEEQAMSEVFSRKVIGGRRTYFFDVKETKDRSQYLVIGEVAQVGDELERHRVMVFEENLDAFCEGLQQAAEFIGVRVDLTDEAGRPLKRIGGTCRACGARTDDVDDVRETLDRIEGNIEKIRDHFR